MLKLIIADDEMDARDNMIACINWEQHGLEIAGTAGDGLTAYSLIMERSPDIVLIDIKMPGLSGLEVIQKVRKQTRHSPAFVIVSGYDDFHYAQQAIDLGVSSYLLKPFSPNDLLRAMRRASRQTSTAGDISDRPLAHLLLDAFHHTPNTGCLFYPDKQEREIIACLSTGDISQLYRLLDQFLETVRTSNDSLSQVFDCFLIFYAGICRVLPSGAVASRRIIFPRPRWAALAMPMRPSNEACAPCVRKHPACSAEAVLLITLSAGLWPALRRTTPRSYR